LAETLAKYIFKDNASFPSAFTDTTSPFFNAVLEARIPGPDGYVSERRSGLFPRKFFRLGFDDDARRAVDFSGLYEREL
jgi:hypothetical protein